MDYKTLYRGLNLDHPVGPNDTHSVYVDHFGNPARYGYGDNEDPVKVLSSAIEFDPDQGGTLHFVCGQRGCGKSSELLRLQALLEAKGFEVWSIDIANLFERWRF